MKTKWNINNRLGKIQVKMNESYLTVYIHTLPTKTNFHLLALPKMKLLRKQGINFTVYFPRCYWIYMRIVNKENEDTLMNYCSKEN